MFTKELVISGLRKQHNMIDELIGQLEEKPHLNGDDCSLFVTKTKKIAKNLKELRKIKDQYTSFLDLTMHVNKSDKTNSKKELETWFIRAGISPNSSMPVNRIGIYTDFI